MNVSRAALITAAGAVALTAASSAAATAEALTPDVTGAHLSGSAADRAAGADPLSFRRVFGAGDGPVLQVNDCDSNGSASAANTTIFQFPDAGSGCVNIALDGPTRRF